MGFFWAEKTFLRSHELTNHRKHQGIKMYLSLYNAWLHNKIKICCRLHATHIEHIQVIQFRIR